MVKKTCIEAIHDHVDQGRPKHRFCAGGFEKLVLAVWHVCRRPALADAPGKAGAYNPFRNEQNKKDGWC